MAGNFQGRKLSRIGEKYDFRGENFHRLLACAVPKDATHPNFMEKTFANSHKTTKFAKVFSLESFLLYGIIQILLEMILISASIHRVFVIDRFLYSTSEFTVSPHAGCMSKSIVASIVVNAACISELRATGNL